MLQNTHVLSANEQQFEHRTSKKHRILQKRTEARESCREAEMVTK